MEKSVKNILADVKAILSNKVQLKQEKLISEFSSNSELLVREKSVNELKQKIYVLETARRSLQLDLIEAIRKIKPYYMERVDGMGNQTYVVDASKKHLISSSEKHRCKTNFKIYEVTRKKIDELLVEIKKLLKELEIAENKLNATKRKLNGSHLSQKIDESKVLLEKIDNAASLEDLDMSLESAISLLKQYKIQPMTKTLDNAGTLARKTMLNVNNENDVFCRTRDLLISDGLNRLGEINTEHVQIKMVCFGDLNKELSMAKKQVKKNQDDLVCNIVSRIKIEGNTHGLNKWLQLRQNTKKNKATLIEQDALSNKIFQLENKIETAKLQFIGNLESSGNCGRMAVLNDRAKRITNARSLKDLDISMENAITLLEYNGVITSSDEKGTENKQDNVQDVSNDLGLE